MAERTVLITKSIWHDSMQLDDLRKLKKINRQNFNSALFLRISDISGDGTNASVTLETTTSTNHADIHLPTAQGKILLELSLIHI